MPTQAGRRVIHGGASRGVGRAGAASNHVSSRPVRGLTALALCGALLAPAGAAADPTPASSPAAGWLEWSEATLLEASRLGRPVVLYFQASWCDACRSFEREVWADPSVQQELTDGFVAIRADADERPDLFARYRRGGVPSVAFLLPSAGILMLRDDDELLPAGGSRFTADEMRRYLALVRSYYQRATDGLEKAAAGILRARREALDGESKPLQPGMAELAANQVLLHQDPVYGGLVGVTREVVGFPARVALLHRAHEGDPGYGGFAARLTGILARSPVRDPLDGTFALRSLTPDWSTPVAVRLLTTQADMLDLFLEADRWMPGSGFREVAQAATDGLLEEFWMPEGTGGAFRWAHFATSGSRGLAWTWKEIEALLGRNERQAAALRYGLQPEEAGDQILWTSRSPTEIADEMGEEEERVRRWLELAADKLRAARRRRGGWEHDDMVYAGANAKVAAALLRSWAVLGDERARETAMAALEHTREALTPGGQGVFHGVHPGSGRVAPVILLEDQVAVGRAWLYAHQATGDPVALERAEERVAFVLERMRDGPSGGLADRLQHGGEPRELRVPLRPIRANLEAALLLLDLAALRPGHAAGLAARRLLESLADEFADHGLEGAGFAVAVARALGEPVRVLVVEGPEGAAQAQELRRAALGAAVPWLVVIPARPGPDEPRLRALGIPKDAAAGAWLLGARGHRGPIAGSSDLLAALAGGGEGG